VNVGSVSPEESRDLRQSQKRDRRRRRILDAAEAVFAERGFHEASMTEIATRSEFAAGTLYLYFRDKADLYGSLILEKMDELAAQIEAALQNAPTAAEGLRALARTQFSFHDANRRFFEIFLQQTQLASTPVHPGHWEAMESAKRRIREALEASIRAGQAAGQLKPGDASFYAVAFLGMILQIIRQSIRDAQPGELVGLADQATEIFLNGTAL